MTEQEAEKQRGRLFNNTRPMVATKQMWRPKQIQATSSSTSITEVPTPPKEDDATAITSTATLLTSPSLGQILESVDPLEEEADMLDYESTPVHEGMDINMVYYLPAEFRAVAEEGEVAQLDFGPKNAIFEKPKEPVTHLKPLYLRDHFNGSPSVECLFMVVSWLILCPIRSSRSWYGPVKS